MFKKRTLFYILILFFVFSISSKSQELNSTVKIDFSQVQNSNTTIYTRLEKSLQTFINSTKWTNKEYKVNEKINCSFVIVISDRPTTNLFKGTLQVFSNRPVFGSIYNTPMLSWQDKDFTFDYTLNEQLFFNENRFSGKNLIDVLAYYVYLILAYDADSFSLNSGSEYFQKARKIASNAEAQTIFGGWKQSEGLRSRASLIKNILSTDLENLRKTWYEYHLKGLDLLHIQQVSAKKNIYNSIFYLEENRRKIGQSFALEIFFGSKKDEILNIFSGGTNAGLAINKLQEILKFLVPTYSSKWEKLKG